MSAILILLVIILHLPGTQEVEILNGLPNLYQALLKKLCEQLGEPYVSQKMEKRQGKNQFLTKKSLREASKLVSFEGLCLTVPLEPAFKNPLWQFLRK